jgi:hypothetical protein
MAVRPSGDEGGNKRDNKRGHGAAQACSILLSLQCESLIIAEIVYGPINPPVSAFYADADE